MSKKKNESIELDMSGLTDVQVSIVEGLPEEKRQAVIDQFQITPPEPEKVMVTDPDDVHRATDTYLNVFTALGGIVDGKNKELNQKADESAICAVIAENRRNETGLMVMPDDIALERREAGTVAEYTSTWGIRPGFVLDVQMDATKVTRTFVCGWGFAREKVKGEWRPDIMNRVLHSGHVWISKSGDIGLKTTTTTEPRIARLIAEYVNRVEVS